MEDVTEVVRAKVSFRAGPTMVKKGDLFENDNPVVVGRENLFTPAGGMVRVTATVPGEVTSPPPAITGDSGQGAAGDLEGQTVPPDGTDGQATGDGTGEQLDPIGRPAATASKAVWVGYVVSLGFEGVTAGLKRADLIAVADGLDAAG